MKSKHGKTKGITGKRIFSLKTLFDGILIVGTAIIVIVAYQWLHPEKTIRTTPVPEPREVREEMTPEPLPSETQETPPEEKRSQGTIEFLYMQHRSGDGEALDVESGQPAIPQSPSSRDRTISGVTEEEPETKEAGPEYSDALPPSLLSIDFDPKKVSPGMEVKIRVVVRDNLSGVRSASGSVRSPSGGATLPFGFRPVEGSKDFEALFTIPERAEMGTWTVASIRLTDNVHNTKRYAAKESPLTGATFEVVDSDSDSLPPEILRVEIETLEAYGGEKVRIRVEVKDNKSGVDVVHGTFSSPSGNAKVSFACREKGEGHVMRGDLVLPQGAESGDWVLSYILVKDLARNSKYYFRNEYPDLLGDTVLRVYAADSDGQPPSLDDIMVSPAVVSYGEKLEISVFASDDISGVSRVSGRVRSPSGKASIPFTCSFDDFGNAYQAEITIKKNTEVGMWRVEYIRIQDQARNQAVYQYQKDPFVAEAVFEVAGE